MKLSVIIPVFNEEDTVGEIVERVKGVSLDGVGVELIVVDDGSMDNTWKVLDNLLDDSIIVVRHERNMGKGAAIRTGLDCVTGDMVLIQDADLEYNPSDYPALIEPILSGQSQVVYGSRNLMPHREHSHVIFHLGGVLITKLANLLYGLNLTDESTCYKVFRTDVLRDIDLECDGFGFCPEVTSKIARKKIGILEVPISYSPRKMGGGKKINVFDGIKAVWILLKYRFFY